VRNISAVLIYFVLGTAHADPVKLQTNNNVQAQAYLFSHRNNCYAIVPNHAVRRQVISLYKGDPPVTGSGQVTHIRFVEDSTDLALAYVDGPLANQCGIEWERLDDDLSRMFLSSTQANLITFSRRGLQTNIPLRVVSVEYEHILLQEEDKERDGEVGQGKSGSLVTIDDVPVGIALQAGAGENGDQIKALRMDAIKNRLNRFIVGSDVGSQSHKPKIQTPTAAHAFEVLHWNVLPLAPENNPDNLTRESGAFITEKLSTVLELDLRLLGDEAQTVKKITIKSNIEDDHYTAPRKIQLLASNQPDKSRARDLGYATNEMSINGGYVANINTKLRWLLLRVHSVWDPHKPVRIDSITIE